MSELQMCESQMCDNQTDGTNYFVSLWVVRLRQCGQNFTFSRRSVIVFLFRVVV